MKYKWADLDSEDDRYGIKEQLGKCKLPQQLSYEFEGTSPKVWGNIIKGRKASGTYGEIIALIKHFGYEEAWSKFGIDSKERSLRHKKGT